MTDLADRLEAALANRDIDIASLRDYPHRSPHVTFITDHQGPNDRKGRSMCLPSAAMRQGEMAVLPCYRPTVRRHLLSAEHPDYILRVGERHTVSVQAPVPRFEQEDDGDRLLLQVHSVVALIIRLSNAIHLLGK